MNVGRAEATFDIRGLKQTISNLKYLKQQLVEDAKALSKLDRSVTNNIQTNKRYVAALRARSAAHAKILSEANGTRQAFNKINEAIRSTTTAIKTLNAQKPQSFFSKLGSGLKSISTFGGASLNGFTQSISTMRTGVSRLTNRIRENSDLSKTWWSRFGQVAGSFWIAYRAINAIEFAISSLTRTFASGVKQLDEYRQSVATVAGMLSLMNTETGSFSSRFKTFSEVMNLTMRESIRLAPKYRLSIDEIGNAYKELSQFGVVVTKDQVNNTLNAVAMIREIAATTGSTARQVRQEIQAMFTGTTRVTDQFGRMIKQSFPELAKQIFGVAAANTTNAEKWRLVINRMSKFEEAVLATNKTISAQAEILQKNLQIVSSYAVETSGIYDKWVNSLRAVNAQLFNADGSFGSLGRTIYTAFYRVWQVIDKLIDGVQIFFTFAKNIFVAIRSWLAPMATWISFLAKWLVIGNLISSSFKLLLGIVKGLFTFVAGSAIVTVLKNLVSVLIAIAPAALTVLGPVIQIAAAFALGILVGRQLIAVFSGIKQAFISIGLDKIIMATSKAMSSLHDKFKVIISNMNEWRIHWLDPWNATYSEIPEIDMSGFSDMGKDAGSAFVEGYKDSFKEQTKQYQQLFTQLKTAVTGLFGSIGESIANSSTGLAIKELVAGLEKLLVFSPVSFPNFKAPEYDLTLPMDKGKSSLDLMFEKLKTMAEYISNELKSVFDDVFGGKIRSLADLWDGVLNAMTKAFQNAMSDLTAMFFEDFMKKTFLNKNIAALSTSLFGSFGGGSPTYAGTAAQAGGTGQATVGMAGGGIITEPIFGVGLNSGTRYALGENGPETVTPGVGMTPNITVNVINNSSQQLNAKQGGTRFDGKRFIIDTILTDVEKGGDLRRLFNQRQR